jgi:rod shape-determining protein MreC
MLAADYQIPDSSTKFVVDTLIRDTLNRPRKYTYLPAKVVGNTISSQTNYMQLERGSKQGVKKGMSVVSPQGIVGSVVEVSDNFSKVMSLLHRNSTISAMLKKGNSMGEIVWDGADPHYVYMQKVSRSAKVAKGDTVLTSTYSANYPSLIMVGTVEDIKTDAATSFYQLKVKPATDFFSIQHVYVIVNARFEEQKELINRKVSKNGE